MKTFIHQLLTLLLAMTASLAAAEKRPSRLACSIGGFFGGSYQVELKGDELHYHARVDGKEKAEVVKPTPEQWAAFRKTLDGLDAWHWNKRYDSQAVDGTQWSATVIYQGSKLESSGSNRYPGRKPGAPYTKEFEEYLAAMKKLLGGREFR